jgi:GT2 family glycosyltransferase/glycosyltransferase involved in cell wall biosynthesis
MPERAVPADAAPRFTVSLVTYRGARWLPGALDSLAAQTFTDYELLVLDNDSDDGSVELVRAWAEGRERVTLEVAPRNLGFAGGHDRLLRSARGELVLLLNQDVELDPGFLAAAAEAFEAHPAVGSVQARLRRLRAPGERDARLDSTGLSMGRDRRVVSRSQGELDGPAHAYPGPVWGADGPAPVYRRAALLDARLPDGRGGREVLDASFFLYKEDVDLAWRLQRLGWQAWYEPRALAWHARGTGGSGATSLLDIARTNRTIAPGAKRLSWRNQRLMQVKNEDLAAYLRDLPWILRRELLSLAFISLADPGRLRVVPSLLQELPSAMRKRRSLQARIRRLDRPGRPPRVHADRLRSRRQRLYDQLPARLRAPARRGYDETMDLLARARTLRHHGAIEAPFEGRGSGRGRILVVDSHVSQPDVHAGDLTTWHYLEMLGAAGYDVHLWADEGRRVEPYASELEALGVGVLADTVDPEAWLAAAGPSLDQVLLARPMVARHWLRPLRRHTRARILYLDHDLHWLREQRRYEATGDQDAQRQSRRLHEVETELFRSVDVVLTFSPDEVPEIRRAAPEVDVRVVTPAFYARSAAPMAPVRDWSDRHDIIFVGAMDHRPNVDAAHALVETVMPRIWAARPDAHASIVGGHVPASVAELGSPRVSVTGHVPDLAPYWAQARLSLLPLRFGAGVKGKVIASLEAGVPVVTTAIGNEGIGLAAGEEALIGASPAELAALALQLLEDEALASSLSAAGQRVIGERFSPERVRADLLAAFDLAEASDP